MDKPKVLFVDDEPSNLELAKSLFSSDFQIHLATSAGMALEMLAQHKPDVLVIDEKMPILSGSQFLLQIKDTHKDLEKIMLSALVDPVLYKKAVNQLGVKRLFSKPYAPQELKEAIYELFEEKKKNSTFKNIGKKIMELSAELENPAPQNQTTNDFNLTKKESEILEFIKKGKSSKEIAKELNISQRTVENHRLNMLRKAGVNSTAALLSKILS